MTPEANQHTSDLAQRLSSDDDATRQTAQEELRLLIAADARRMRSIQTAIGGVRAVGALSMPAALGYRLVVHPHGNPLLAVWVWLGIAELLRFLLRFLRKRPVQRIIALDIPQAIGPLIDVLATDATQPNAEIKEALTRLLPRLRSSDASLLTPSQRKHLAEFLGRGFADGHFQSEYHVEGFRIVILHALEQIGDETALPIVERLAREARHPGLRSAAQECLPFLQQRADQARIQQTLLRASSGPGSSPSEMLRPAEGGTEALPGQLLRASSNVDEA